MGSDVDGVGDGVVDVDVDHVPWVMGQLSFKRFGSVSWGRERLRQFRTSIWKFKKQSSVISSTCGIIDSKNLSRGDLCLSSIRCVMSLYNPSRAASCVSSLAFLFEDVVFQIGFLHNGFH